LQHANGIAGCESLSGGRGRQAGFVEEAGVVRRRLNRCSSVFAFGLEDSLFDVAHCHLGGLAMGLQVVREKSPFNSTLSI